MPPGRIGARSGQSTGTGGSDTLPRMSLRRATPLLVLLVGALLVELLYVRTHSLVDLRVYRLGGRAILDGAALYDARDAATGLPFTYTPFAALLFVPAALLPSGLAAQLITLASAAALMRCAWLIVRAARAGERPTALPVAAVAAVAVLTEPVGATLGFGQVNLILMWLVLEDLLGAVPARWRGVLVGIATGLKLTPGLFVVYLLATRRWADAARATAACAATIVIGFAVQPGQAWDYWTGIAYDSGRVGGIAYAGNQSVHGAVERLTGPDAPGWLWLSLSVLVVVAGLVVAVALHRAGRELHALTAVAFTMLLVSPISWNHHWVWVMLLLGLMLDPTTSRRARIGLAAAVLVLSSRGIWLMPYRNDAEYGVGGLGVIAQNAYVLLALALLLWLAQLARHPVPVPRPDRLGLKGARRPRLNSFGSRSSRA